MLKTILIVIHALLSLGLIATVLLQSGRSAGLSGAIGGGAESFFGKKKGLDELLHKLTNYIAVLFMVTAIAIALIK